MQEVVLGNCNANISQWTQSVARYVFFQLLLV